MELLDPVVQKPRSSGFVVFAEPNVRILNSEISGAVYFGFSSYINSGLLRSYCEIGRYCSIGRNVTIGLGNHDFSLLSTSPFFEIPVPSAKQKLAQLSPKRRVIVGNDVWIGDSAMISSGVHIGDGAIIAANAVVSRSVAPFEIVGGVAARHIRWRFDEKIRDRILRSRWWNLHPSLCSIWCHKTSKAHFPQ